MSTLLVESQLKGLNLQDSLKPAHELSAALL